MKNNKQLTIALVNSILRVLDQVGPNHVCRRRRGVAVHRQELRATLDLDRLHQTGGTPGQDPQVKHRRMPLTLGVRVLERRPSPSPDLLADGTLRPSHLSERSPGDLLRHPRLGHLPLPGCIEADEALFTEFDGGRRRGCHRQIRR
jgi:hypothetical protein